MNHRVVAERWLAELKAQVQQSGIEWIEPEKIYGPDRSMFEWVRARHAVCAVFTSFEISAPDLAFYEQWLKATEAMRHQGGAQCQQ
jgi:hypothetical protein